MMIVQQSIGAPCSLFCGNNTRESFFWAKRMESLCVNVYHVFVRILSWKREEPYNHFQASKPRNKTDRQRAVCQATSVCFFMDLIKLLHHSSLIQLFFFCFSHISSSTFSLPLFYLYIYFFFLPTVKLSHGWRLILLMNSHGRMKRKIIW